MLKYFLLGSIKFPTYGMVVLFGVLFINIVARLIIYKSKLDFQQFVLIEFVGGVGAIAGAKLLARLEAFLAMMPNGGQLTSTDAAGYSYYGGVFGFLIFVYLYRRLYKVEIKEYVDRLTFLFPLLHVIWKIGCYLGGCCIGVPYNGVLSVVYPEGVNRLSGTGCFPIQLVESATAMVICIILIVLRAKNAEQDQYAVYLQLYGMTRFVLEFFRYHKGDTIWSFSHIMSCICFFVGLYMSKNKRSRGAV